MGRTIHLSSLMLTRSKAKALATEDTVVVVSPSATGQGVHKRWIYPRESPASPSPPSRVLQTEATSFSSGSSLSTLSDSSLSSISDASFQAAPPPFYTPPTSSPLTPRKLQRSPLNHRWVNEGTSWRLTLVHDSFTPEDAIMQERMIQRQEDEIYDRQFARLMQARADARRALGLDIDIESDEMDTDDEERRAYIREDTQPAEERNVGLSHGTQRLGPHGTELVGDDDSSLPPVYPDAWVARRKMAWQPFRLCPCIIMLCESLFLRHYFPYATLMLPCMLLHPLFSITLYLTQLTTH